MFCSKCNSEISENSKFCSVCGEPVKQKKFCFNCKSELSENAKFCAACGARVEDDTDFVAPVIPAVQDTTAAPPVFPVVQDTTAEPAAAAVQNTAAEGGTVMPSGFANTVPTAKEPVIEPNPSSASAYSDTAPKSTGFPSFSGQSESGANVGYIPPYAPQANSGDIQTPTVVSNAPAAAAVVKKSRKKPVIITIVAVLVVALAAGVIFFFTNKATVLSTIMGKSNYAAMVEGNSLKQAASMLDGGSISSGIKTASGVYSSLATLSPGGYGAGDYVFLSDKASGNSDVPSVDLSQFFSVLNSSVNDAYGVNSVMVSLGMNAELTDTARNELKNELNIDDDKLNELIEYINGTKISAGITSAESSAAFKAGVEVKNLKLDLKVLMNSKGEAYIVLPFASEKALLVKVGEALDGNIEFSNTNDSVILELDEKEIERFLNEIVELYIENYKTSEIEMENGELSVYGVSVSGKVLTAQFDSKMVESLITDIGEKLAGDNYFKGKIVEYLKKCGVEITESEYEKAILDAVSELEVDSSAKLKITTVINNSGDVLGKSYQISSNGNKATLSYAETKNEFVCELKSISDEETASFSVKIEKESDTAGTATVKIVGEDTNVTFKIKYNDVKTEKFCGKEIGVGTYEISLSLPKNFEEEPGMSANYSEFLVDTRLILSTSVSGNTCTSSVGLKSDKLGAVTLTYSLTAENNTTDLVEPSSVIDLTPYVDGEEPDEAFKKEFLEYLESIRDAIRKQNAGEIGDTAADAIDDLITSASQANSSDVSDLMYSISSGAEEVLNLSTKYDVHDYDLYSEVSALYEKYYELYLDFMDVYYREYSLSTEAYEEFKSRLDDLEVQKNALEEKYMIAAGFTSENFEDIEAADTLAKMIYASAQTFCASAYTNNNSLKNVGNDVVTVVAEVQGGTWTITAPSAVGTNEAAPVFGDGTKYLWTGSDAAYCLDAYLSGNIVDLTDGVVCLYFCNGTCVGAAVEQGSGVSAYDNDIPYSIVSALQNSSFEINWVGGNAGVSTNGAVIGTYPKIAHIDNAF
ncbi:MAG: zinc-ribbon domain-containing protein [Oscillospiraceae bacterium]|nr:zinc-ribbon domain-containing protein [Oscillospiraceae bacterium]